MVSTKKILLSNDDETIGRRHLVLVTSVLSCLATIISVLHTFDLWSYYILTIIVYFVATGFHFIAAWPIRIRFIVSSIIINFFQIILKVTILFYLFEEYIGIRTDCFLDITQKHCMLEDIVWRSRLYNIINGIIFLLIATLIDVFNFIQFVTIICMLQKIKKIFI